MIPFSWGTIALIAAIVALGGAVVWLGFGGGKVKREGTSLTEATADLIVGLSDRIKSAERKISTLQVKARSAEARINILQGELALANSEVAALELLIREQAERIADLRAENTRLRETLLRLEKKTGRLGESMDESMEDDL